VLSLGSISFWSLRGHRLRALLTVDVRAALRRNATLNVGISKTSPQATRKGASGFSRRGTARRMARDTSSSRIGIFDDAQHADDDLARTEPSPALLTAADRRFLDFLARTALRIVIEEAKLATSSSGTEPSKEQ